VSAWEVGRSTVGYVIAGILLSIFIGLIAYSIASFIRFASEALNTMYEIGVNATGGGNVEYTAIPVGNETVRLARPSNPALSSVVDLLFKLLQVVASVLTHPVALAVLIALTLITYALAEKRGAL
jgi:hypothetical protein